MMPLWTIARPSLRDVRVRVALARHAVRGPARVRDAEVAVRGICVERVLQLLHLADGAQPLQMLPVPFSTAMPAES